MRSVQYRRWCPAQSPLRVEFPVDLLTELQPPTRLLEQSGLLYGWRHGREVRVLTTRPEQGEVLESVGVFVIRSRGEVFLTESNLRFFDRERAAVALVIAGGRAGFFVREPDESIQTVRSHEEFPVSSNSAHSVQPAPRPKPAAVSSKWIWPVAALVALVALPLAGFGYLRPVFPLRPATPLSLHVREGNGEAEHNQLHLSWTSGGRAILQIVDGVARTAVTVPPDESSATYVRRTGEVDIALIPLDGDPLRRESTRFVGQPVSVPAPGPISREIEQSKAEAEGLRAEATATRAHIDTLQKAISRLANKRR